MKIIPSDTNRKLQNPTSQYSNGPDAEGRDAKPCKHLTESADVIASNEHPPNYSHWNVWIVSTGSAFAIREKPFGYE